MKLPSPAHPISIAPARGCVTVRAGGQVVARSSRALVMHEAKHDAVYYVPRQDVEMDRLTGTQHKTHCAYKGDASYFTIKTDSTEIENAVWSYTEPYPAVGEIKEYLAFYPTKVQAIEFEAD